MVHHRISSEFWIYHPANLINNIDIVPHPYMTVGEKLNALMRLWTLLCLAASFFSLKYVEFYWLVGTLVLILLYFKMYNVTREGFSPCKLQNNGCNSMNSKYFPAAKQHCTTPSPPLKVPIYDMEWATASSKRTGINTSSHRFPFNHQHNPADFKPSYCGTTADLPECLLDPCMMYSININTTTPQPGEQVNPGATRPQPISTNMGIVTADFGAPVERPVTLINGDMASEPTVGPDNVYDPRSCGYGDDRRSYLEPVTGQRRFFYKDVDQPRTGLTELSSNINRLVDYGTNDLSEIQRLSSTAYVDISNAHRKNIQESFMSKYNEMTRQRRMMPIRTFG